MTTTTTVETAEHVETEETPVSVGFTALRNGNHRFITPGITGIEEGTTAPTPGVRIRHFQRNHRNIEVLAAMGMVYMGAASQAKATSGIIPYALVEPDDLGEFSIGYRISDDGKSITMALTTSNTKDKTPFQKKVANNVIHTWFSIHDSGYLDTTDLRKAISEEFGIYPVLSPAQIITLSFDDVLALMGINQVTWGKDLYSVSAVSVMNLSKEEGERIISSLTLHNLHSFTADMLYYISYLCLTQCTRLGNLLVFGSRDALQIMDEVHPLVESGALKL